MPPAVKTQENKPVVKNQHLAQKAYARGKKIEVEPDWSLLEKYLPLVKSIVSRMRIYFPPQAEQEDFYSIGITGLITAIRRCDPEKIDSFSSYAALRIRGAILDELRRMDWMPRANRIRAKKLRRTIEEVEQRIGGPATEEEMCKELGVSRKEYAHLLDEMRPISLISLDSPVGQEDGEGAKIHEVISDETELDARERCEKREVVKLMKERIHNLPEVPRKVLMMYYFENMRLAEIAEVFDLTESRICQIHAQAIISLRTYLQRVNNR